MSSVTSKFPLLPEVGKLYAVKNRLTHRYGSMGPGDIVMVVDIEKIEHTRADPTWRGWWVHMIIDNYVDQLYVTNEKEPNQWFIEFEEAGKRTDIPPRLPEVGRLYRSKRGFVHLGGRWLEKDEFVMVVAIEESLSFDDPWSDFEIVGWDVHVLTSDNTDIICIAAEPVSNGYTNTGWYDLFINASESNEDDWK